MTNSYDAEHLEELTVRAIQRWTLSVVGELHGGYLSRVFECRDAAGEERVLKIASHAESERRALAEWAGVGAVRLLDAADDALLLDRIRPGEPLPDARDDAASIVAALLEKLHIDVDHHLFPSATDALEWRLRFTRREAKAGAVGLTMLDDAAGTATSLISSTEHARLLHGDLCGKNILRRGQEWIAIDPLPYVGDPCSDVGFFAASYPPADDTLRRAERIASRLGYDVDRCRTWAAVWAVCQACETWREDAGILAEFVSSTAVQAAIRLAHLSESQVEEST